MRKQILQIADADWVSAVDQDGGERPNGHVAELGGLDLADWPKGSRVIVRRERAHPGAQLSFTDHDGHRFQAILTDQPDADIALVECRHRARARVEDHIRNDKQTGLSEPPVRRLRTQQGVAGARDARPRPHHMDTDASPHQRTRALRTQAPALPPAAHRRASDEQWAPRTPAPRGDLAQGPRARRRVQPLASATRARLTPRPRRSRQDPHRRRQRPAPPAQTRARSHEITRRPCSTTPRAKSEHHQPTAMLSTDPYHHHPHSPTPTPARSGPSPNLAAR